MTSFSVLEMDVIREAESRNMLRDQTLHSLLVNFGPIFEQMMEAERCNDDELLINTVGASLVLLTLIAAKTDLNLVTCFARASEGFINHQAEFDV